MFNVPKFMKKISTPWFTQILSANKVVRGNMKHLEEPFKVWTGSLLVLDIAGELHALTRDWRMEVGQKALSFKPAQTDTDLCINPLSEVKIHNLHETKGLNDIGNAQTMASLLIETDLPFYPRFGGVDSDHWVLGGRNILTICILHELYKSVIDDIEEKSPSLAHINSLLCKDIKEFLDEVKYHKYSYRCPAETMSFIQENVKVLYNMPENELRSMISVARTRLNLFQDPIIAHNTSRSDIELSSLVDGIPFSLYLNLPCSQFGRLLPLYRLFFGLVIHFQEKSRNHSPLLAVVPRRLKNWLPANMEGWFFLEH